MRYLEFVFTLLLIVGLLVIGINIAEHNGRFSFRVYRFGDWLVLAMPLAGLLGLLWLKSENDKLKSESFKTMIRESEEFIQLINLLQSALLLSENVALRTTARLAARHDFNRKLSDSINKLEQLEVDEIEKIWAWFAPKGLWDDLMGVPGSDLGVEIFSLIEQLRSKTR